MAVAASVDRSVHHAEVAVLQGEICRLKGKGQEVLEREGRTEKGSDSSCC